MEYRYRFQDSTNHSRFLMRVSGLCHYGLHLRIESVPFTAFRTQIIHFFQCGYVGDVIMNYSSESSQFRSLSLEPKQLYSRILFELFTSSFNFFKFYFVILFYYSDESAEPVSILSSSLWRTSKHDGCCYRFRSHKGAQCLSTRHPPLCQYDHVRHSR